MNKTILSIIIIAVVLIGGYFFLDQRSSPTSETNESNNPLVEEDVMDETDDQMMESKPQAFNLVATNFRFSQSEIRVKQGDRVRITLDIEEGFHDWVIDEFNASTEQMPAGSSQSIEFIADQVGEFEYYCSVGQHRQLGMVGTLIVEE